MKKKTKILISVVAFVLVVLVGSFVGVAVKKNRDPFSASLAFACDAQKYEQKSDKAYLTFEFELFDKKTVKSLAVSENQNEQLSPQNIKDIIGVQVLMNVPQEEIEARQLDTKNPNLAWLLFAEGTVDDACEIVDVFFKSR